MSTSNALSYEQTNYNKEVEDQDDLEARVTVLETLLGSANVYTETQFTALDTSSWTTAKLVLIVDPSGAATVRVWNPYTETFG